MAEHPGCAADLKPTPAARRRRPLVVGLLLMLLGTSRGVGASEPAAPRLSLGLLLYLSAQHHERDGASDTDVLLKRGHVDLQAELGHGLSARLMPDVTVDGEGTVEAPVKLALLRWSGSHVGWIHGPAAAAGRVPTPWIGFEESIDRYRMQDGTFMDRLGFFPSADEGAVVEGLLGPPLPGEVTDDIGRAFAGRWGSFAAGVYSGSGFKATDQYDEAVAQGRLTVRPLPASLPGLQLSGLVVRGEGNTATGPDWRVDAVMASWQQRRLVATLQAVDNRGVGSGAWVDAEGEALPGRGWSAFVELRQGPGRGWAGFVRHDHFDRDRRFPGGELRRSILALARHDARGSALVADVEYLEQEGAPDDWRIQLTLQARLGSWTLVEGK